MNAAHEYVRQVMDLIPPAHPDYERIELDVRTHVEETLEAADGSARSAFDRMGPPRQVALGYVADSPMRCAGVGVRVLAFLIDAALGFAVFGLVAAVVFFFFGALAVTEEMSSSGPPEMALSFLVVFGLLFIFSLAVLSIAYFPLLEWRYSRTLGKYMMGIHVVGEDGLRAGLGATVVRRIPFFFEFFWIDALVAFFTERRQRAFDLVARTLVVETTPGA